MVSRLVRRREIGLVCRAVCSTRRARTVTAPALERTRRVSSVWLMTPRRLAATTTASSDHRAKERRGTCGQRDRDEQTAGALDEHARRRRRAAARTASSDAPRSTRFARARGHQRREGLRRTTGADVAMASMPPAARGQPRAVATPGRRASTPVSTGFIAATRRPRRASRRCSAQAHDGLADAGVRARHAESDHCAPSQEVAR